ncbi:MAG: TIGR01212 family radical SAM protein [Eubacteriales bacterium]
MDKTKKQSEINPFSNSDSNKRYYTYDYYLKKTYGGKCAKIPLDAGFSCPNLDGRCAYGGCIYCSGRGSGDFAESPALPIKEQYELTRNKLASKWSTERCIPYFQARTNTYAPLEKIKEKFEEALLCEGVVAMNVATRADCLPDDVVGYLADLSERVDLTVELGLQTVNDEVANFINRGHTFAQFIEGYNKLRERCPRIKICVHLIFGLPGEDGQMMLESVKSVAKLRPDMVKIHLLHVLRGTKLAEMYESGEYIPMEREKYIETVAKSLQFLPKDTVIARLTGDGMRDELLAPLWSLKKVSVINDIDKYLFEHGIYQGMLAE